MFHLHFETERKSPYSLFNAYTIRQFESQMMEKIYSFPKYKPKEFKVDERYNESKNISDVNKEGKNAFYNEEKKAELDILK
jgi:hypothetical protein